MKKVLTIIGGIVVGLVVLFGIIFLVISLTSKKLVCTSSIGDITIMYNDSKITGYTAKGMTYDLEGQNEYAQKIGVEAYIEEFSTWFATNTDGTCKK